MTQEKGLLTTPLLSSHHPAMNERPSSSVTSNSILPPRQLDLSDIDALTENNNTTTRRCHNPLNTLTFIKRRTIEHYHNLSLSGKFGFYFIV